MPVEVEGPDGKVHSFPDTMADDQIMAEMSKTYGSAGSLVPHQAPQPGSATAASGAIMPSMQGNPQYQNSEDMRNLVLGTVFPHMNTLIKDTPGHEQRKAQAKKVGENLGNLEERQRAGLQVVDMLHQLGETADEGAQSGDLDQAIGPVNSSPSFQRARAATAGKVYAPYERGYNLHNQLTHDIHGLTTAFVSSASRGGVNMSDARQKVFEETMGAMMRSTSKDEFDKIKKDAERIIRGTFGLAPGAAVGPTRSSRPIEGQVSAAPVRQQFRNKASGAIETFEMSPQGWKKVE